MRVTPAWTCICHRGQGGYPCTMPHGLDKARCAAKRCTECLKHHPCLKGGGKSTPSLMHIVDFIIKIGCDLPTLCVSRLDPHPPVCRLFYNFENALGFGRRHNNSRKNPEKSLKIANKLNPPSQIASNAQSGGSTYS